MKKILLIAVILISFGVSDSNAQFFNKLIKRVLEKTEDVIINKATNKVADKAGDKTGEAMDKLLNPDFGSIMIQWVSKKKRNSNAIMECVAFEPTNLVINTKQ